MSNLLKKCIVCEKEFKTTDYIVSIGKGKFCSKACCDFNKVGKPSGKKGYVMSKEEKDKISMTKLKITPKGEMSSLWKGGKARCLDCNKQLSTYSNVRCHKCAGVAKSGVNSHLWISDRTLLKDDSKERGGQLHRDWSRCVKNRDNWACRIADNNCDGKVVAHHILPWRDFPELHYIINNGITLCHAHHPRKRDEEAKLSPYFQSLVAEMK